MNSQSSPKKRHEGEPNNAPANTEPVHERAVLCCRMARLLRHALSGILWPSVRFADRGRLDRALAQLENDIRLARAVIASSRSQAGGTTKAASSGGG